MKNSIILSMTAQEMSTKQLRISIQRKKKQLQGITEKAEHLKMDLEDIQEQYNGRIGWLFVKDNKLDVEIIKHKTILDLVNKGLHLEEAIKEVENSYYNDLLNFETQEEIIFGEKTFSKMQESSQKTTGDIKKLWKRLIVKFHPDLVTDKNEKKKREELIKKINKAYKDEDLEALQVLESHIYLEDILETSKENLDQQLVIIENAIIKVKREFKKLGESQWFQWKKRLEMAKKQNVDIFAEMEKSLLDDIGRKIDLLHNLKAKIHQSPQAKQ